MTLFGKIPLAWAGVGKFVENLEHSHVTVMWLLLSGDHQHNDIRASAYAIKREMRESTITTIY